MNNEIIEGLNTNVWKWPIANIVICTVLFRPSAFSYTVKSHLAYTNCAV